MKPKSQQEQSAAERQVELLTNALDVAKLSEGYWMNPSGKYYPRFYPKGPEVSPFNAIMLTLFADTNGYKTPLYTTFPDAKIRNEGVRENEKGVPFNWYNWNRYVNRNNPDEEISRKDFLLLSAEDRKQYKGIHNREIRYLFNLDQTLMPLADPDEYKKMKERYGGLQDRGYAAANEKEVRTTVNAFVQTIKDNLVPMRRGGVSLAYYDVAKDAVYLPEQKSYAYYPDYVQDMMRNVVRATGHSQRLAREGMVMRGGKAPSEEALRREALVVELASGVKMLELGLPARISQDALKLADFWCSELHEDRQFIDALESDVNNALDVIRKAEKGEKVVYSSIVNERRTEALREKKKPQVSSRESAILTDIICNHGMKVSDSNFGSPEEKAAFLEKFDMTFYHQRFEHAMAMAVNEDPELAEAGYSEALQCASHIDGLAREYKPFEWSEKGTYEIYNGLKDVPDKERRDFVVVMDKKNKGADVILPEGAFTGGKMILPDKSTRNFFLSPDEVMPAAEREERKARVVNNEVTGFSKQRIAHALEAQGVAFVRFFNKEGIAGFHPDDRYFEDKTVSIAKLNQWKLDDIRPVDISGPVERSRGVAFKEVSMVCDDENRWVLYMLPNGEKPFAMHPDKEDVNKFFTASKQGNKSETEHIRRELGQKYYAMSKVNPGLCVDIFGKQAAEEDVSRIQRVTIYPTRDKKYMCVPVVDGMGEIKPREVTSSQWQRMFLSEDAVKYKRNLAANLFSDVLHPEVSQECKQEEKQEEAGQVQSRGRRM